MGETITIHLNTTAQTQGVKTVVSGLEQVKGAAEGVAGKLATFAARAASIAGPLLGALSGAALAQGTKRAIDGADALAKQAQSAGILVEQFSAMVYAGNLANVSQEQLITASKGLSEWLAKTGQGSKELGAALLEQADIFAGMADGPEKVRLAQERFGRSGQALIPLLNSGSAALRAQMAEARAFGVVVGPEFASQAEAFNDNLTRIKSAVHGLFSRLAESVLPALLAITERITAWSRENVQRISGTISDIAGITIEAFRENQLGNLIAVSLEAGIEAGIRKGMQLGDAIIRAALEYSFGPGFVPLAATAGKLLAQALLTAVKLPVDVLSASFEWLSERAYNLFVSAFNKFAKVFIDIFNGTFNTLVEGLNKIKIFGEFAPIQFKIAPEVQIEQRSFMDIVKQAQQASAAAIDGTVKYFDDRIRETREILTTGQTVDQTQPVGPNAQERAQEFFRTMRENLEKRVTSSVDVERTTSERDTLRTTITKEQLEISKRLYDQQKAGIEIEIEKLKTRGLYDEATGRTIGTLQEEADAIKGQLLALREITKERQAMNATALEQGDSEAKLEAQRQEIALAKERLAVEREILGIRELAGDVTFFERMQEGLTALGEQFENVGASIADVLVSGIGGAIRSVSDGIWQVIDGTATWANIFQNVARSIISDLIEIALREIFLDNLKRTLMTGWSAFMKLMRGKDVIEANTTEASKTPALAANATLASISSWGVAAVIGVAAIAAILATMGAFEQGGVVTGGEQLIRVNERGTESVLNAQATSMLGADMINRLNSGAAGMADLQSRIAANISAPVQPIENPNLGIRSAIMANEPEAQAAAAASMKQTLILVDDRQGLIAALESAGAEAKIIQIVRNNKIEIGIS